MKTTAELQVTPVGSGVSVRNEIARAVELLKAHDLHIDSHASGTDIEGELGHILSAVEQIHSTLHDEGAVRLVTYLKLETRTDKAQTLEDAQL